MRDGRHALIFETGEAVMDYLGRFSEHEQLSAASFTAIGAFSDATFALVLTADGGT